ncbi:MAG: tetratricopeptide repeat protein [Cyanobacteria bacterium HKST-UBA02]|nr:tetratricopeptide repeat protein [Cyanobacteria bacterium HKST-UBA02]
MKAFDPKKVPRKKKQKEDEVSASGKHPIFPPANRELFEDLSQPDDAWPARPENQNSPDSEQEAPSSIPPEESEPVAVAPGPPESAISSFDVKAFEDEEEDFQEETDKQEPPEEVVEEEQQQEPRQILVEVDEEKKAGTSNQSQDLHKARIHMTTADSALENDNFQVAKPLLEQALKLIRESEAYTSEEAQTCLHKLGDCNYHLANFEEALENFVALKQICEKTEDAEATTFIVALQKIAKTCEKLERFSEAKMRGREAINKANALLAPSHPLVTAAYRLHMNLLRKIGAYKDELEGLEQEFQDVVIKGASGPIGEDGDLDDLFLVWTGNFNLENIEKQRQLHQARSRFRNEEVAPPPVKSSKPAARWVIILVVGALIGAVATTMVAAVMMLKPETPQTGMIDSRLAHFVGSTYQSADGLKSLKVMSNGTAELTFGRTTTKLSVKIGEPSGGPMAMFKQLTGGDEGYVLEQIPQGFKDPEGTILFAESSTDQSIIKAMKTISDLANYYFSRNSFRYPSKRKQFRDLGPETDLNNPLGSGMRPLLRLRQFEKDEGDVAYAESLNDMASGKAMFKPDKEAGLNPGLIECMIVNPFEGTTQEDGTSFLIRAYGNNGKFITASKPGTVFVMVQKNGIPIAVVKESEVTSPIKNENKTTLFLKLTQ